MRPTGARGNLVGNGVGSQVGNGVAHRAGNPWPTMLTFSRQGDTLGACPPGPPDAAVPACVPGVHSILSPDGGSRILCSRAPGSPSTRLLTLTGAGGSGKTRLALEVLARRGAGEDREYMDGEPTTCWVELAAVSDPDLLPQQLVRALGVREELRGTGAEAALPFLSEDPLLLVLDNCEHLVDACADAAQRLLAARPRLSILATSREALGVTGERAWLVPGLSVPPPDADHEIMAQAEALRLFEARARDVSRDFELNPENTPFVAEICRRLDGIPLAIELAAARVRVLSVEQIRDRLNDVFSLLTSGGRRVVPRHRTLRAAIDWSHELLPESARRLLMRLSVFRGGFTLDGAAAVGGDEGEDPLDVLEQVALLVDRSLLRATESDGVVRYSLLETIRQYGALRLDESGESEEIRGRQARFIAAEVARSAPHMTRANRQDHVNRLLADIENVREALAWTRSRAPALHVEMVGGLWWFWFFTRFWKEAGSWIEGALALSDAHIADRSRSRLLLPAASPVPDQAPVPPPAILAGAGPWRLRIHTLGPFEIEGDTVESGAWNYARPREVLVLFLLNPRGVTRQEIGDAIWPESTSAQVKNSCHVTLHHLRKQLGDPSLVALEGERYRLVRERGIEWDAEIFEEEMREFLRAREPVDPVRLEAALARYRGPLLDGTGGGRWLEDARDRFRRLHVDGLVLLARAREEAGDLAAALAAWGRVVAADELNEEGHRGLMRAWSGTGSRDRALVHFTRLRMLLRETLEADPEAETLRLHQALAAGAEARAGSRPRRDLPP